MNYWLKRLLNLFLQSITFTEYYYRYSIYYCPTHKKLVSRSHTDIDKVYAFGLKKITKPKPEQFFYRPKLATLKKLPSKIDRRANLKNGGFKIYDQGRQGSCTANCGCCDKAYQEIVQKDYPGDFSRAFLYYMIRYLEGSTSEDSGGMMEDIGKALAKYGVCTNKLMPYKDTDFTTSPSPVAYAEGLNYKANTVQSRLNFQDLKAAIAEKGIVRFGVPIPNSFYGASLGGWVPCKYDTILGYHAMACVGYDDTLKSPSGEVGHFIVANSWGQYFGDKGYVYIPYRWMQNYESKGQTDNWVQLDDNYVPPPPIPPDPTPVDKLYGRLQCSTDKITWKTLWEAELK